MSLTRRRFCLLAAGAAVAGPLLVRGETHLRRVPSTGEPVPPVGLGTWITFNVGNDEGLRRDRLEVMRAFFELGGGMIDSSPMYGSSEDVIGWCLERLGPQPELVGATKVWTRGRERGIEQMNESARQWGVDAFDVMQVHNLVDWRTHLDTLFEWKADGRVRHVGITTSHGMRHAEMERIMNEAPVDFVQLTYNVLDREAERRLLPLAAERGIGVIVNRPFRRGALFDRVTDAPLPGFTRELDCRSWAEIFIKFIVSHPAVTCAIPATTRVDHLRENMRGGVGPMPDRELRRRMADHVASL
ncbi:MAG: aldo/keto reductase [Gammaproteobacteria bacterium]|nr:aldo/keto reductase [Gammaproteobacteria bacterium]